jgi:ubiquinone/menaquinone biosynthesis C-methylase UbiE
MNPIAKPFYSWKSRMAHYYLDELGYGSGKAFTESLISSVKTGDVFLDAGCGEGKISKLLPDDVHYVGIDIHAGTQYEEYDGWIHKVDIIGDLHKLPIASLSCDSIALLHVLEHVKNPLSVLTELERVAKPGAYLFVDVPFLHEIHHAPHDHSRFTRYGLESLFTQARLEIKEIRPSGGYFRMLGHVLNEYDNVVFESSFFDKLLLFPIKLQIFVLQRIIKLLEYWLDLHDIHQLFTCGYHCILRKPTI